MARVISMKSSVYTLLLVALSCSVVLISAGKFDQSVSRINEVRYEDVELSLLRCIREQEFWSYCPYVKSSEIKNCIGNLSGKRASGLVKSIEKITMITLSIWNQWKQYLPQYQLSSQICLLPAFDFLKRLPHNLKFQILVQKNNYFSNEGVIYGTN